jgi:hypothetical protein
MTDYEQNKQNVQKAKTKKVRRKSYDNTNHNNDNNNNNNNSNNNSDNNNNINNEARTVSFSVSMVKPNSPKNSAKSGYLDTHSSVPGLDGPMLVR